MSRTLEISSLLRPDLGNISTTPQQFACIISVVEELGEEDSSPSVESLVHAGKYLNWLKLYELPDAGLELLADKLSQQSADLSHVVDAIGEALRARKEFRESLSRQEYAEALARNDFRSQIEAALGYFLDKYRTMKWLRKQGLYEDKREWFNDLFVDCRYRFEEKEPDPRPILLGAVDADRII